MSRIDRRTEIIVTVPVLIADIKHQLRYGATLVLEADEFYIDGPLRGYIPFVNHSEVIAAVESLCDRVEHEASTEWTWKK